LEAGRVWCKAGSGPVVGAHDRIITGSGGDAPGTD